nr:immunoglobulin light chain junction region [Macaca mulatta]MOW67302.1 immunoglobulin light chain junction region [Macaca mulatta]
DYYCQVWDTSSNYALF